MNFKDISMATNPDLVPRQITFISSASEDEIERGEAVRVPGTEIWIHPKRCAVITNIGEEK